MFSKSLLRSFTRAIPSHTHIIPRSLPNSSTPRLHFFSQKSRLLRAPPPPPRARSRRPDRIYYQSEIQNVKPLITPEALQAFARSPQFRYILIIGASGTVIFYYSNLETVPVSGRRRFNCYSDASVEAEGVKAYNAVMQEMQGGILPTWDPRYKMVSRVMKRLIPASGLENVDWEVHVVASPSTFSSNS